MDSIVLLPLMFENQPMRRTADGDVSIFDLIKVVGGVAECRNAWKRIAARHPEVVSKCHYFKFPGKGQKETPVIGKDGALKIIGLLPGEAGSKYRDEAAKLVLAWYEAPASLAIAAIDRVDNSADAKAVLEKAAERYINGLAGFPILLQGGEG